MTTNRFGIGQAGKGISLGRPAKFKLTDKQREICGRCDKNRWEHERNGLVPDHEFISDKAAQ